MPIYHSTPRKLTWRDVVDDYAHLVSDVGPGGHEYTLDQHARQLIEKGRDDGNPVSIEGYRSDGSPLGFYR